MGSARIFPAAFEPPAASQMTRLASSPPVATKRPSGLNESPMTSSVWRSSAGCLALEGASAASSGDTPSSCARSARFARPVSRRSSTRSTRSTLSRKPWLWPPISTVGTDMVTAVVASAHDALALSLLVLSLPTSGTSSTSPRLETSEPSTSDGALEGGREPGRSSPVATGCSVTSRVPKPQLASQSPSAEKARLQYQSFALGSCNARTSSKMSQIDICMSSPPEARKRLSGDHARHLTPAAHCRVVARSKPRSTSSTATSQLSPPTASSLPLGAKAVAWRTLSNSTSAKCLALLLSAAPSAAICHITVFILWSLPLFVIRPCISSVPPPPASMVPSGENARLLAWPSCISVVMVSRSGAENNVTVLLVVPTATNSLRPADMASDNTSPFTSTPPISSPSLAIQTVTAESASTAATYKPLGE
mmetsp:Transcript_60149/g.160053  ORF Transcript_60149/g.160053 Transcript_60149/m.160053 type:complete len:422 (-) Transcript_60149:403-1668(-)